MSSKHFSFSVAETILQLLSGSRVTLMAVLPQYVRPELNPNITALNVLLRAMVRTIGLPSTRLQFVDCSRVFTTADEARWALLFKDKVHPTAEGYVEMFRQCLLPSLNRSQIPRRRGTKKKTLSDPAVG